MRCEITETRQCIGGQARWADCVRIGKCCVTREREALRDLECYELLDPRLREFLREVPPIPLSAETYLRWQERFGVEAVLAKQAELLQRQYPGYTPVVCRGAPQSRRDARKNMFRHRRRRL